MNMDDFGVDWERPVPTDIDSDNHVDVPKTNLPLNTGTVT